MRKLFVILAVIVIVTLLATSCSFPFMSGNSASDSDTRTSSKDRTSDTDTLSENTVKLVDVKVEVDNRDFSRTEINTCDTAVQVESNSCGITIEAAP